MEKQRIDVLLVEKGHFETREQARRAVMAGLVRVGGERVDKPGTRVSVQLPIEVKGQIHPYVSRGGLKLEEALRVFGISVEGRVMLDIGASTGGFTDCALQRGARHVYAIDVGYGQLAWKLRQDPRVTVMERTNFRYLDPEALTGDSPDFATIDVSFISLAHILPNLSRMLQPGGEVVALVKPQFEAGREQVGKKGIVRDPRVHRQVLLSFAEMAGSLGYSLEGLIPSPIRGSEGNIEFLAHLRYTGERRDNRGPDPVVISEVVEEAHRRLRES
ncbi:TlyA family RNA methyltransferase [Staphylospora marina]|uniref:TlyA family RNA methyltransferase n=1 Tax=Staphylospora marina TaxID=2490858 RepID=UPI000F5BF94F|nr:TlyA family RNA methyltransferase [Staphylospora marina]